MRKLDVIYLLVILGVAATLRLFAPWDDVLGSDRVNFLETDSWYHVRLVENQVRNYPHHVTVDPYASADGQYVAVAPLLDFVISTAVVLTQGTGASTAYIERVAAMAPAAMGVLAVVAVWLVGTIAFDRRAGLMAALLAAVLPGHFLDRTLVGFVDHHALEVLLSFSTLAGLAWAMKTGRMAAAIAAGGCLGLYLLAWGSGAYLVAILAAWMAMVSLLSPRAVAAPAARAAAIAATTALIIVVAFQDPISSDTTRRSRAWRCCCCCRCW